MQFSTRGPQQHAGNQHVHCARLDVFLEAKLAAIANLLDGQIVVDKVQFIAQRAQMLVLAQQPP